MQGLFLKHTTVPGRRDEVEAIWRRHMLPAVEANDGHLIYVYSFGADPDTICAFQVYKSKEAAGLFLKSPAYLAYLEESRPLLGHEPTVEVLTPRWIKGERWLQVIGGPIHHSN